MEYFFHLATQICLLTILAQSLSLLAGFCGQVSLAHASFYAIGAYCAAILATSTDASFAIIVFSALALSAALGALLAVISIRTVDDYYIIITIGFQFLIYGLTNNWISLTNGPNGITGIPTLVVASLNIETRSEWALLCFSVMMTVWLLLYNLSHSPLGQKLRLIGQDEVWAQAIGINVFRYKVVCHAVSACFASLAGILYAHYSGYIDPRSFGIGESILILSAVILGQMRDLRQIFLAATALTLFPELLRFIGIPDQVAASLRQILYGIFLIIYVRLHINKNIRVRA